MIENPQILLSVINTKLRDNYDSLSALCEDLDYDLSVIRDKLASIGYKYDPNINQFIRR